MTGFIAETAVIGERVILGNFVTVGENVRVGSGSVIGNNVVIHRDTVLGDGVRVDDNAVIGKLPMRASNSAVTKDMELPPARIGADSIIGTSAVLYRGCDIGKKVLVADLSTIRENVTVGDFTIIGRGVAVENFCRIGNYCKLETNVYIAAYSEVGDRCFIAPCVATSNDNYLGRTEKRFKEFKGIVVGKGGRIGVNATILPGKVIGEDAVVAAGAVLTRDAESRKVYAGVPAKYFREVPAEELLENQKGTGKP